MATIGIQPTTTVVVPQSTVHLYVDLWPLITAVKPIVPPFGSSAGGGPTVGQLFPVGNE